MFWRLAVNSVNRLGGHNAQTAAGIPEMDHN